MVGLSGFSLRISLAEEHKMRAMITVTLCLAGMLGFWGAGIAGSPDQSQIDVNDEDAFSCTDSAVSAIEAAAAPPAAVPKTGQRITYGPRDDGQLRKGVAWPIPRFTDKGNGTVRDNLTGLIWLKDVNCKKFYAGDTGTSNSRSWNSALVSANRLKSGYCGLSDGSVAGNWRLPNVRELESLTAYRFWDPALSNRAGTGHWSEGDPFLGVTWARTPWSSTTCAANSNTAWIYDFSFGYPAGASKTGSWGVWPVR
ncbi:protein of unknown function DUF1566 [Syntrophobacter fumaroxidans MPOB]|uniref:Lcl C-terminal domain-containing protein n=1 Tax=Syntrophobacter fumaroxidans (strain DSM 10017 / MPOB) TaxID=335543 RepID=A0LG19_SYNFM|nr:protein of unknown function DUF1566 [Syntrophobacter fumaroxidans MPOB]